MKQDHQPLIKAFWSLLFLVGMQVYSNVNNPLPPSKKTMNVLMHEGNGNGHIQELNTNYRLFNIAKNDIEGYKEMLSGSEFFLYPSIREDIGVSMIARATTGKMGFEFLTGEVPVDHDQNTVTFFMLSDIDLNFSESFDISVNDKHVLTFNSNEDGTLSVTDNPGNGNAEYVLVKRDGNGDGLGAFRLTVPTSSIEKGKSAKIRFVGHKKNSNCWVMIFKATDAVARIKESVASEAAFVIKQKNNLLYVDAPAHFSGKKVHLISDGKESGRKTLRKQGELAKASFAIAPPKKSFAIVYDGSEIALEFEKGDGTLSKTDIVGKFLYHHRTHFSDGWFASLTKLYKPEFYETYDNFFDKKYDNGLVSIMNSSHQDIAWVDRPEVCIILRDTLLLKPVLNDAFIRDDYGFDIEDGLMLREYLERHPESQERLTTLLNKKLISVGATYNCPYEDMYDAEDQVRQLYLGKKWVKKTFGGYDSKVYWNVDVPGKSLQTPQILKKAGVDYMIISRHAKSMFHWQSPDGSSVFTYSPGHYGNDLLYLSRDLNNKMKYGAEQILFWEGNFEENKIHTPLLSSQDMLPAIDYSDFIEAWNAFDSLKDDDQVEKKVFLPNMELMTVDEFMPLAEKNATKVDTIMGERPNVWVYIHGPGHHDALTASREASKLLPAAEKFLSIANILDPKKVQYPFKEFDEAWQAKIYPDHGWGGHDGDITDNLFKENLVKARTMGKNLLNKGMNFISSRISKNEKAGIPIVLFNSLSWNRTDPVTTEVSFAKGEIQHVQVVTSDKKKVLTQSANVVRYDDGSLKSADITFIAKNVPSIGYVTYYITDTEKVPDSKTANATASTYNNPFYKVSFEKGGIAQIFDKEMKKDLFLTDNFKVGDVFTLQSVGNGAGEFGDVQQPSMVDFDKVSLHDPDWIILENGPVYTTYRLEQQILHAIVRQDVTLYHDLKRVYFDTSLRNWSGELYREFRTAFPINMNRPEVAHEVPFGSVRVGKDEIKTAGERYTPLCKDVHPRAIVDWISATDDEISVTLSSSVAAADWIDPTGHHADKAVLQNLLLASRTSCHWEGNEYSQAGNHDYHNVLTSNRAGSIAGQKVAKQKNEPLYVMFNPDTSVKSFLPETKSFFAIDSEDVMISTIKKAEDSEDIILRMYNVKDQDNTVNVSSHFDIRSYKHTNIIEEDPKIVSPQLKVGKYAIETFSLEAEK
ncbi:glycosyl hydrolase-related protein [Allomuricauda sp. SCSIO 65647]|uniref:glycoside hydrolase family 38 N-terminal domain-containing protein n=1 Tax=Allomuricauda sp. SCSIO 65647 TaxID=2908843 RepID=UPI001F4676CF|nr:glycosyl hydrolase-related protein [Muricauda sp. SCSIO 65647]UJH68507.1 glycosyl hydrolase-related protein [Muricauda sp. SCSIO 65647]